MATPFLGEIKLISFNYPPRGWAFCNGQLLPINQNQALFSILGNTYGGDGRVNFGLPNLQARTPIHRSSAHSLGESGGEQGHTLALNEMPTHAHSLMGSSATATAVSPAGNVLADTRASNGIEQYRGQPDAAMSPAAVAPTGGGQAHSNLQPYLVLNFVIALQGIFPSQTQPTAPAELQR
ncbi:MAG TPA: tail fiber protein [Candidatus Sulfotelmatobacter sp.]|nr:tail fiber protein [Candidatus Sulfotelmatobacter sp.]